MALAQGIGEVKLVGKRKKKGGQEVLLIVPENSNSECIFFRCDESVLNLAILYRFQD